MAFAWAFCHVFQCPRLPAPSEQWAPNVWAELRAPAGVKAGAVLQSIKMSKSPRETTELVVRKEKRIGKNLKHCASCAFGRWEWHQSGRTLRYFGSGVQCCHFKRLICFALLYVHWVLMNLWHFWGCDWKPKPLLFREILGLNLQEGAETLEQWMWWGVWKQVNPDAPL